MRIPSLPSSWPFAPRLGAVPPILREKVALPGLGSNWSLHAIPGLALDAPGEGLLEAFGRGGVFRSDDKVVRPYRRGGLVRYLNARIYPGPARFLRELEVHRALWNAGFPTVEPLGCAWRQKGWGVEGLYLTRWAEGTPWPRCFEGSEPLVPHLRGLLEALCAWGLHAPDLNATNVLVTPSRDLLILDWDKARWGSSPGLFDRYRGRLLRSVRKLEAPAGLLHSIETWL